MKKLTLQLLLCAFSPVLLSTTYIYFFSLKNDSSVENPLDETLNNLNELLTSLGGTSFNDSSAEKQMKVF